MVDQKNEKNSFSVKESPISELFCEILSRKWNWTLISKEHHYSVNQNYNKLFTGLSASEKSDKEQLTFTCGWSKNKKKFYLVKESPILGLFCESCQEILSGSEIEP